MTDITEMVTFDVDRVDAVGSPANGTEWLILKSQQEQAVKRDFDPDVGGGVDRDKIPAGDFAGKNRSFPIVTPKDVHDAADSIGRAGDDNYPPDKLKANIIRIAKKKGPKFVAQLPKSWRKDMKKADGLVSHPPAPSTAAALPADGSGDSLGVQNTDPDQAELTGQTMENCTLPALTDDERQQARQDAQTQKAKSKRSMDNPDAPTDSTPGSGPWEGKDVALGEQTIATLEHALELARTFTEREKAEATASHTSKETSMTAEELVKLLDERDERRAAAKADKREKKAAKAREDAKAAKKAAKAEAKRVAELEARVEHVENQPARSRPILSGAAAKSGGPTSAFKELEDRIARARGIGEELDARQQLTTAKMIVNETARERGDIPRGSKYGPDMTPLITSAHQIGDDTSVSGV